jgi:squalene-associated FAD-dependent desaturase
LNPDLVVVGGGWAGCSAAFHASRRGLRVLLLEAGPRLGGRASSFVDPASGEWMDQGQHLFLGAYRETLKLLAELGTASFIEFQDPLRVHFLMDDGRLETLRASRLPGPLSLGLGLANFPALPKAGSAVLKLSLRGGAALGGAFLGRLPSSADHVSVEDWLASCGQDPAITALLWEPMVLAALNARPGQARLREFLAVLGGGFLRGGSSAALGLARAPLARLLEPLPTLLRQQGSDARTGAVVEGVEALSGGGWRVRRAGGSRLDCPGLILALPARRAAGLLGSGLAGRLNLEAQAERPESAIVSVWLWSPGPLLPADILAFGPQGGAPPAFHWGFSRALDGGWRTCIVSSAAQELADKDNALILAELAAFLASRGRPYTWTRARVVKERSATPVFETGSGARLGQGTALPGLALAGDWTETRLPATIEGAVLSGRLAFEALSFETR